MIAQETEQNIVLSAWVITLLLGILMLAIKRPHECEHPHYHQGKVTCAVVLILFGIEILFQWIMRVTGIANAILSVSVYLFTFCTTSLLLTVGFCTMMTPKFMDKKQKGITTGILVCFALLLIINYFLPVKMWQAYGIITCSTVLLLITCISIYKCVIIYRKSIKSLRTFYSDLVENIMRWMPGVGAGLLLYHISAPFICFAPRWVGIYQVSLGMILFIYTFICITNFSLNYNTVAHAMTNQPVPVDDSELLNVQTDEHSAQESSMNGVLKKVMQDKEQRWLERGGYHSPGITIEQAARDMGTNRSYLSRYLNEVRQLSFYEWIALMRIREAELLLVRDHNASIEQIGTQVGFTSASTFSRTFKKLVGMTPHQWRMKHT